MHQGVGGGGWEPPGSRHPAAPAQPPAAPGGGLARVFHAARTFHARGAPGPAESAGRVHRARPAAARRPRHRRRHPRGPADRPRGCRQDHGGPPLGGTRPVPTAHISLDDVREWVCSGFADPQAGWNDHSEAQYRLARRTCGFAARNFLANGISCILDDAVFPDRPVVGLGGWKRHVGPALLPVVLLPGLEIVLERNAARSGNRRLSDEEVARIHGRMAGWYGSGLPIIDNSHLDVEGTARALDETLARVIAQPAY